MRFQYHSTVLQQNPQICGGVIVATNLRNGPSPESLLAAYAAEQAAAHARMQVSPNEIPSLNAWRAAFRRFGANPTKYRSAAEALLRRLTKKGDIPSINTLVDIGNMVSIRYALPVAFFDLRDVRGAITVHHATGHERFQELDSDDLAHPEPGEVVFSDDSAMVVARRWCWRQSAESASRADTTTALVTVESQHEGGRADIAAAVNDLLALLHEHAGDPRCEYAILDANQPLFASSV